MGRQSKRIKARREAAALRANHVVGSRRADSDRENSQNQPVVESSPNIDTNSVDGTQDPTMDQNTEIMSESVHQSPDSNLEQNSGILSMMQELMNEMGKIRQDMSSFDARVEQNFIDHYRFAARCLNSEKTNTCIYTLMTLDVHKCIKQIFSHVFNIDWHK